MEQIKYLVSQERYVDASAVAIYLGKTYETRELFENDPKTNKEKFDAFENLLLADAQKDFDCYCRYLDYRQPLNRNLYLDRRKYLKQIADVITNMYFPKEDEIEYDIVRIKLRTRSAKSEIFNRGAVWVQANFPHGETLYCVGGGTLKDNIHGKRVAFMDEYWDRHLDVFPDMKIHKVKQLEAGVWFSKREYADITTVTVGGSIEGHVQCTNMLIMDDLVSSNEINSSKRLEEIYSSDIQNAIMRRYLSGKIILIGTPIPTLTGIQDPLDRFYDNRKDAGFNCIEIVVPSLDENDESNYAYRDYSKLVNGKPKWTFTTEEFLREKRAAYGSGNQLEIATFETIYQMKAMDDGERLFAGIETYDEEPEGHYREINILDPADSGEDSTVIMHCRIYDSAKGILHVHDIFKDKRPMVKAANGGYLEDLLEFLIKNGIHILEYESNLGGTLLGETISEMCKEKGHMFTYKDFKQNKQKVQRILNHAMETLRIVRVKKTPPTKMYADGVNGIKRWNENSKHDDEIDCLTLCVEKTLLIGETPNSFYVPKTPVF